MAICLFEVDLNWLARLIFAKRMMSQAMEKEIVTPEQCAKSDTDPNEGTMLKAFHNNIHRTMRINLALSILQSNQWGFQCL